MKPQKAKNGYILASLASWITLSTSVIINRAVDPDTVIQTLVGILGMIAIPFTVGTTLLMIGQAILNIGNNKIYRRRAKIQQEEFIDYCKNKYGS